MRRASAAAALPGRNAAALHADLDLDQRAELDAESCATARGRVDLLGGVEARARSSHPARARRAGAACASPTTWLLTRMSLTPPRTSASASPTFCTHCPTAPARSAAARSPRTCGSWRAGAGARRFGGANSAIFAMLRSNASRSIDQRRRVDVCDRSADLGGGRVHRFTGKVFARSIFTAGTRLVHRAYRQTWKASAATLMSDVPRIRIADMHKSFGPLEVLRGVSFDVQRGSVVSIIGASGSGKSTLLRCINHLEPPNAGEIYHRRRADRIARRRRGQRKPRSLARDQRDAPRPRHVVFQQFNLWPHMTVLGNVDRGADPRARAAAQGGGRAAARNACGACS